MSEIVQSEPFVMNIGPQHPSTHGVFRMKATVDGERIIDAEMVIGYLHRSMEKLAEERTYTQNIPFTDRTDYLSSMSNNLGYCLAVEEARQRRGTRPRAGDPRDYGRAPATGQPLHGGWRVRETTPAPGRRRLCGSCANARRSWTSSR